MQTDERMAREILSGGARDYDFTPMGYRTEQTSDWRRLARGRTKEAFERLNAITRRRDKHQIFDHMLQSGCFVFWNTHPALEKPCDTFVCAGQAIILFDEHIFPVYKDAMIGKGCYTFNFLDFLRKKGKIPDAKGQTAQQGHENDLGSSDAQPRQGNRAPDDAVGPDTRPFASREYAE